MRACGVENVTLHEYLLMQVIAHINGGHGKVRNITRIPANAGEKTLGVEVNVLNGNITRIPANAGLMFPIISTTSPR